MKTKEGLFRELYRNGEKQKEYADKIPLDIRMAFIDNEYAVRMNHENVMLLKAVFGSHYDSVSWFLNEWRPGFEIGIDEVTEKIMDIDQFINWMKKHEDFK